MPIKKLTQFLLTSVFVVFSTSLFAENIITNGSFEQHAPLNHGNWGTFSEIPGWSAEENPFEIQMGRVAGIGAAEGNNKLELDANSNSTISTTLSTQVGTGYILNFSYAPRVQRKHTNTNNISVWWDDKKIKMLSGAKRRWKNYSFIVGAETENTKLTLKAEGESDSNGGLIDNVQVFSTACFTDNKIKNGSFEDYAPMGNRHWGLFKSIPNWKVKSGWIEIQKNNISGISPVDGIAKAELDSRRNSTIEQTINNLEEGEQYQLILSYSPRVNNHKNTNKIML